MDEIQAAMLLVSLGYLSNLLTLRRAYATFYNGKLHDIVACPPDPDKSTVVFDYQIQVRDRDGLTAFLADRGIETRIKHPTVMADQPVYKHLPYRDLPVARQLVKHILSLPLHENLSYEDLDRVACSIQDFHTKS
jgi:dTDP-4-amino-4,6-dideoxygalactose transaminase